jgi:hypothetical protein
VINSTLCPAILDCQVLTFDISRFSQALTECGHHGPVSGGRRGTEKPDHRHPRLLRQHGQWPCNYSAAEKPDEFPSPHGFARAED